MQLKLKLELETQNVLVSEAIPLKITLKNMGKESIKLPHLMAGGRVTSFVLYDENGKQIGIYNEFSRKILMHQYPGGHKITLNDLDSEKSWEWKLNLNEFMEPLAPGTYSVQILYKYQQIEIRSNTEKFTVHQLQPIYFDILNDRVLAEMVYTILVHKDETTHKENTVFNVGYRSIAYVSDWGGNLLLGEGARPSISKADFINAANFDHDTYRWLAWTKNNSLYAASVFRNVIKAGPVEIKLKLENLELIPRPIQHVNKGVTLFVKGKMGKGDFAIITINLDEHANEIARNPIVTMNDEPSIASVSAASNGVIHLVWTRNEHIPISWLRIKGNDYGDPIILMPSDKKLKIESADIVYLGLYLPGSVSEHSIMAAFANREKKGIMVKFLRISIENEESNVITGVEFLLEGKPEKMAPIHCYITPYSSSLIGIVSINDGSLYHFSPNENLEKIMELDPKLARFSSLVLGRGGNANLFYADEKGINLRVLIPDRLGPI